MVTFIERFTGPIGIGGVCAVPLPLDAGVAENIINIL